MFLLGRTIPQVRFEPCATLVEGDGMPEVADVGVGRCEGETARDDADRSYGVPLVECELRT